MYGPNVTSRGMGSWAGKVGAVISVMDLWIPARTGRWGPYGCSRSTAMLVTAKAIEYDMRK